MHRTRIHAGITRRIATHNIRHMSASMLLIALMLGLLLTPAPVYAQMHEPDAKASEAFAALLKRYRELPAIDVKSSVRMRLKQGDQISTSEDIELRLRVNRDRRAVVSIRGFTAYLRDGQVHVIHEATDDAYFNTPDDGSPYYALFNLFLDLPYPHLAIALGEEEPTDVWMQLHSKAPWIVPTIVVDAVVNEKQFQRIGLTSDHAMFSFYVDPQTGLLDHGRLEITSGVFVQSGHSLEYEYRFQHTPLAQPLPDATFAFDPGDRQRTMMVSALMPQPERAPRDAEDQGPPRAGLGPLVGKPAPEFILATMDGNAIDLEELQGRIVVLDFWASWCGPCMVVGLPALHEVAAWARQEMLPVRIITVNAFEISGERDSPQRRLDAARAAWRELNFTLPVAMDYTNEVAESYGVRGLPTTFIIRSDGIVHSQHGGAVAADVLRRDIEQAIRLLEQEPM